MLIVSGDAAKVIADWRKLFEESDEAMNLASRAMAEEMLGLTLERFRVESDPYGKRWKPKQRPDGRKTLSGKTSRLKTGWHIVRCDGHGWMIAPSVAYALFHQDRTVRMVQRMMVPDSARGLPRQYQTALEEAAQDGLTIYFNSKKSATGGGSLLPRSLSRRFSVRDIARRMVSAVGRAGNDG